MANQETATKTRVRPRRSRWQHSHTPNGQLQIYRDIELAISHGHNDGYGDHGCIRMHTPSRKLDQGVFMHGLLSLHEWPACCFSCGPFSRVFISTPCSFVLLVALYLPFLFVERALSCPYCICYWGRDVTDKTQNTTSKTSKTYRGMERSGESRMDKQPRAQKAYPPWASVPGCADMPPS